MTTQTMLKPIRIDTPFHANHFDKIEKIIPHVSAVLEILGLDLEDESIRDTPRRVATMYVQEVFSGLNPAVKPKITLFENVYGYKEMLLEKDITFFSYCEHHLVPFYGKAHVAYFPNHYVVGLSKLNRLVQYIAKKPQVQERLTVQIFDELQRALQTKDVAVVLEATHLCIASRGVEDVNSLTRTSHFGGKFEEREIKNEFLQQIESM
ncbi:MAG: GTP cyclohydrolase I FolE [Bacteroidota bacterium]|nr:GTP cyclohydrolase I FolE [Bacteroidota bacterium]